MGYTNVGLKEMIYEMYPEIGQHGISMSLVFNNELKTFDVKLKKNLQKLTTHIEQKDADECMDGTKCIHLGTQIDQFIRNFDIKK